jgi:hypothetical protein
MLNSSNLSSRPEQIIAKTMIRGVEGPAVYSMIGCGTLQAQTFARFSEMCRTLNGDVPSVPNFRLTSLRNCFLYRPTSVHVVEKNEARIVCVR